MILQYKPAQRFGIGTIVVGMFGGPRIGIICPTSDHDSTNIWWFDQANKIVSGADFAETPVAQLTTARELCGHIRNDKTLAAKINSGVWTQRAGDVLPGTIVSNLQSNVLRIGLRLPAVKSDAATMWWFDYANQWSGAEETDLEVTELFHSSLLCDLLLEHV